MHTPTVTITPAPVVVLPEDVVTLALPRRSAEVLLTVLSFVGGPYGDGEPRTRMDQISLALIKAGVKNAQGDLIVTGSASPLITRVNYPVGLRLGWRGGRRLNPHPSFTGGPVDTIADGRALYSLQIAQGKAAMESEARKARDAEQSKREAQTVMGASDCAKGYTVGADELIGRLRSIDPDVPSGPIRKG